METLRNAVLGKRSPTDASRSPGHSPRAQAPRSEPLHDLVAALREELETTRRTFDQRLSACEAEIQAEKAARLAAEQRAEDERAARLAAEEQLAAVRTALQAEQEEHGKHQEEAARARAALEAKLERAEGLLRKNNLMAYGPGALTTASLASALKAVLPAPYATSPIQPFQVVSLPGPEGKLVAKIECLNRLVKSALLKAQRRLRQGHQLRLDLDLTPQQQAKRRAMFPLAERCRAAGGRPFFRGVELVIRPAPGAAPVSAAQWLEQQQRPH